MEIENNIHLENVKTQIDDIFKSYEYTIKINEENNKIEVTVCFEMYIYIYIYIEYLNIHSFLNTFKCFTEYTFNENNCSISSITYICDRNGIPIIVKEKVD